MNSPLLPEGALDRSSYVTDAGAAAYAKERHGLDGAALLDPIFQSYMKIYCPGQEIIDIGSGAAPWAIYAVRECGARAVSGYDNSPQMRDQAIRAVAEASMTGKIAIENGTAKHLPVDSEAFAVAISLNVGCALPSIDEDDKQDGGTLSDHFTEMERVLRPGGTAIVTAPVSLKIPFTTYGNEEAKLVSFDDSLSKAEDVRQAVGSNGDVLRATIIEEGDAFRIARAEDVWLGRRVLRKIPGLVVPNFAHDEAEYESAIITSGLEIVERKKPTLASESEAEQLGLGRQYIEHNPFAIYLLQKPA